MCTFTIFSIDYGRGYALDKPTLHVEAGDMVHWKWKPEEQVENYKARIEQTASAESYDTDENYGFLSGQSIDKGKQFVV